MDRTTSHHIHGDGRTCTPSAGQPLWPVGLLPPPSSWALASHGKDVHPSRLHTEGKADTSLPSDPPPWPPARRRTVLLALQPGPARVPAPPSRDVLSLPGPLCPGSQGPTLFAFCPGTCCHLSPSAQGLRHLLSPHTSQSLCHPPLIGRLSPLTGRVAGGIPLATQGVRCQRRLLVSRGEWRVAVGSCWGISGLRAPRRGAQQRVGDALETAVKGARRAGLSPVPGDTVPGDTVAQPLPGGRPGWWEGGREGAGPCSGTLSEDAFGPLHLAGHVLSGSHPCVPRAGVGVR